MLLWSAYLLSDCTRVSGIQGKLRRKKAWREVHMKMFKYGYLGVADREHLKIQRLLKKFQTQLLTLEFICLQTSIF